MKKIWKLLVSHLRADFSRGLYISVGLFLAIAIFINYKINLENGIIDRDTGKFIRVVWYFILYSTGYFVVSFLVFYFNRQLHFFRSGRYWFVTVIGLFILSFSIGFPYLQSLSNFLTVDPGLFRWTFGVTNNIVDFVIAAIPLLAMARIIETKRENFGVNAKNIDLSPYWQILMIVAPLVLIASFEDGFRNYYPMYRRYEVTELNNPTDLPEYLFAALYEIAYGMDFFNVEFMFRGFMVIGVSQIIGKEAILPMVSVYCFIHFGKPVGECISSIFGGYILGVVAFYTRNVWGGVVVHVGLAWMMELAAFVQREIN